MTPKNTKKQKHLFGRIYIENPNCKDKFNKMKESKERNKRKQILNMFSATGKTAALPCKVPGSMPGVPPDIAAKSCKAPIVLMRALGEL